MQRTLPAVAFGAYFSLFSGNAQSQVVFPAPQNDPVLACSFRHPICVHAAKAVVSADPLGVLRDAEQAWDIATDVLDFPSPDPSPRTNVYDIFIEPDVDGGAHTTPAWRDPGSAFDRASAFTLIDAKLAGAQRAHAVARGVFRAISYRVAPATDDVTAESETTALADLVVPNGPQRDASFELRPDRAVCDGIPEAPTLGLPFARGASFFYSWLDAWYASSPGGFTRALWALTPTKTLAGATHWTSDPDTFDVLRMTFKVQNTTTSYDDLLLDFAAARAFDPVENARRDWDIDWPKQARRLAPALPIAPTGSSFLLIRKTGAPAGSRLRVEATWEEHAAFHWLAIKLDAHGAQLGRVPIPAQDKGVSAQITLDNLDDTAAILLVASNAGDDAVPFDPDARAWEPHGYLVTVAAQ